MTIQELVGKAQKAIRDAEEAIQALNEIVEAINLDANGFKVIELTVDAAYQILLACDDDPEALTMKYDGRPVAHITKASDHDYYAVFWRPPEESDSLCEYTEFHYKQGDAQCITIVAPK